MRPSDNPQGNRYLYAELNRLRQRFDGMEKDVRDMRRIMMEVLEKAKHIPRDGFDVSYNDD